MEAHAAGVVLGGAGLGLIVALIADRLQGCASLASALALGCLAQAQRPPAVELTELQASIRALTAEPAVAVPDEPAQASNPAELAWLCEGRVVSAPQTTATGTLVRLAVTHLGLLPSPSRTSEPCAGFLQTPLWIVQPSLQVAVTIRGQPHEPLWPGDRVRLRAQLHPPQGWQNPGAPDRQRRAAGLGLHTLAAVEPDALLRWDMPVAPEPHAPLLLRWENLQLGLLRAVAQLRTRLLAILRAYLLAHGEQIRRGERYALVAALVLGERGALQQTAPLAVAAGKVPIEPAFRAAGIYHVLSVSGLHLAVACFAFYGGLTLLLRRLPWLTRRWAVHRLAAAVALPATVLYTLLTGAELATLRAAGVASLWLLAIVLGRRARLSEALAATVLWILRPGTEGTALLCFEPSLQLSLAATLGIAYLRPLGIATTLRERLLPGRRATAWMRLVGGIAGVLDATLAAALATAPLCAFYFANFQAAGVIGNLLAVPLGELVIVPVGLGGAVLGLAWPAAGGLLLALAGGAATFMLYLTRFIAALGLSYTVAAPTLGSLLLWTLGLCLLGYRRSAGWVLCALALGWYLLVWLWPQRQLTLTALDVGQGDALVVELPRGKVMVVDGGPAGITSTDLGEQVVGPYLHRRGHCRIDVLVASHPHPDHIGGLVSLLEQFQVGELWTATAAQLPDRAVMDRATVNGVDNGQHSRSFWQRGEAIDPIWQQALATAARRGVPIVPPHDLHIEGVTIAVLAPCRPGAFACHVAPRPDWGHNNNSVVLRIEYAGRSLLLSGDLELEGELALLERHDAGVPLRADVLKAPHHCSQTSSSESFIKEVAPAWVICSLGLHNRYHFPHAEVVERYRRTGSTLLRTDRDGGIQITIRPDGQLAVATARRAATR